MNEHEYTAIVYTRSIPERTVVQFKYAMSVYSKPYKMLFLSQTVRNIEKSEIVIIVKSL